MMSEYIDAGLVIIQTTEIMSQLAFLQLLFKVKLEYGTSQMLMWFGVFFCIIASLIRMKWLEKFCSYGERTFRGCTCTHFISITFWNVFRCSSKQSFTIFQFHNIADMLSTHFPIFPKTSWYIFHHVYMPQFEQ